MFKFSKNLSHVVAQYVSVLWVLKASGALQASKSDVQSVGKN